MNCGEVAFDVTFWHTGCLPCIAEPDLWQTRLVENAVSLVLAECGNMDLSHKSIQNRLVTRKRNHPCRCKSAHSISTEARRSTSLLETSIPAAEQSATSKEVARRVACVAAMRNDSRSAMLNAKRTTIYGPSFRINHSSTSDNSTPTTFSSQIRRMHGRKHPI